MRARPEEAEAADSGEPGSPGTEVPPSCSYLCRLIVQASKDGEKGHCAGCSHLPPCGGSHCCVCKCISSSSSAGNRASVLSPRLSLLLVCRNGTKHPLCSNMLQ
ncbi:hypothetical protein OIU84_011878 [Salix udensis]|uniref:Uncharacterized protein n=1 Tax=Salix udensis TaxID=889485 RepID=A0AAD6JP93_9ROSI|nr:hypothetical protein OIU84_011878 [Salix udensis]